MSELNSDPDLDERAIRTKVNELKRRVSVVVASKANLNNRDGQVVAMKKLLEEATALLDQGMPVGEICEIIGGR